MRPHFDWSPPASAADEHPKTDAATTTAPAHDGDDTIRVTPEEVEALVGPRSRPTLSDSPRAMQPVESDDERDFFLAGEEGRYEGGPATLIPLAIDDEPEERPKLAPLDPALLARRRRFVRAVSMIVGAMGAIAAVALVRGNATAHSSEALAAAAMPPVAAPIAAKSDVDRAPAPADPHTEAPKPPKPAPVETAKSEPAASAEPVSKPAKPAPEPASPIAKKSVRKPARIAVPEPAPAPAAPAAAVAPAPSSPSGPPPTAAFPTP